MVMRIAYIDGGAQDGPAPKRGSYLETFRSELGNLGVEWGRDYRFDIYYFEDDIVRLQEILDRIDQDGTDAIIAMDARVILATQRVNAMRKAAGKPVVRTPIVMAIGPAQAPADPDLRITGAGAETPGLKQLQFEHLKELLAKPNPRVTIVFRGAAQGANSQVSEAKQAATDAGFQLTHADGVNVKDVAELEGVFPGLVGQTDAVYLVPNSSFALYPKRIVKAANAAGIPTMYFAERFVEVGGLIAGDPDRYDICRRAAARLEKVLRNPGDEPPPIDGPSPDEIRIIINRTTAIQQVGGIPSELEARRIIVL
jgi:ABC-type uncharacterized transport system substrate-binding protein